MASLSLYQHQQLNKMSSSAAIRRLRKEYQLLQITPEYGIAAAAPVETNVLEWHFVLHGTTDTPYQGGFYHGKLMFPTSFPMKPPSIMMVTDSGRFVTNKKICMSMSDFHPELWNPLWGVRTILVALLSFMNGEELTTGGMEASVAQRVVFAQRSIMAIIHDPVVNELFPDVVRQAEMNIRYLDSWPPPAIPLPHTEAVVREAIECCSTAKASGVSIEDTGVDEACETERSISKKSKTAINNARKRAKAKATRQAIAGPTAPQEASISDLG